MITCLLVSATDDRGSPARSELLLEGDTIELGRDASCHIQLPDHRVSLRHATIEREADGRLHIRARADALLIVDAEVSGAAELVPGTRIDIGPYRLVAGPPSGNVHLVLELFLPPAAGGPAEEDGQPLPARVAFPGIGKCRLGLWLGAAILIAYAVLVGALRLSSAFETWQARLPITLAGFLSPAPLASGHAVIGSTCSSCHKSAFRGVADGTCTECHAGTALHLAADSPKAGGIQAATCKSCHSVHQSKAEATGHGSGPCMHCHAGREGGLAKVRGFDDSHPPFHLSVPAGRETLRVSTDNERLPAERSGLKFSHRIHLDKGGVSTPDGDTVLTCTHCHVLAESGNRFAPMAMEKTCQQSRCHKLRFEEPARGVVPHGSVRAVLDRLRLAHAAELVADPAQCGRAGKGGPAPGQLFDCAYERARRQGEAGLFRTDGDNLECALCHEISPAPDADAPWRVTPVRIDHDWQPKAVFSHARHGTLDCADCHDKDGSQASGDISFPGIGKCRECHAGEGGGKDKVASRCASCHRFHRVAKPAS